MQCIKQQPRQIDTQAHTQHRFQNEHNLPHLRKVIGHNNTLTVRFISIVSSKYYYKSYFTWEKCKPTFIFDRLRALSEIFVNVPSKTDEGA